MGPSNATDTIREYYAALRAGEPLAPFFGSDERLVKVGISERLAGYEAVADGLREQTATTEDWTVRSRALQVTERDCHAWFADVVEMAWTEPDPGTRHRFETRWSGTLEDREGWVFVGMHVSAPHEL